MVTVNMVTVNMVTINMVTVNMVTVNMVTVNMVTVNMVTRVPSTPQSLVLSRPSLCWEDGARCKIYVAKSCFSWYW